jgi:hypothetical protein
MLCRRWEGVVAVTHRASGEVGGGMGRWGLEGGCRTGRTISDALPFRMRVACNSFLKPLLKPFLKPRSFLKPLLRPEASLNPEDKKPEAPLKPETIIPQL